MTWAYYIVRTSEGRALTIRGISSRDAEYVFNTPCKRNSQTTLAKQGEYVVTVERVTT